MAILIIKTRPNSDNVIWNLPQQGTGFTIESEEPEQLVLSFDRNDLTAADEQALNTNPSVISYTVIGDSPSAAAATLGRRGGSTRSERKTAAARTNGRKGGRPPKQKTE